MSGTDTEAVLSDDSHLVTTTTLADIVARETGEEPPSDQSIRNYARDGRVTVAEKRGKVLLFDRRTAPAQVIANKPDRGWGGRRRNAGRRPARKPDPAASKESLPIKQAADARDAIKDINNRYDRDPDERPRDAVFVADKLNCTNDEWSAILAAVRPDALGLTNNALDRLEKIARQAEIRRKELIEAGKLVRAEDVEAEWEQILAAVRREFETAVRELVEQITPLAWVSPEVIDSVCGGLYKDGVEAAAIDRVRERLARPREQALRIESLARAKTDLVLGRLSSC